MRPYQKSILTYASLIFCLAFAGCGSGDGSSVGSPPPMGGALTVTITGLPNRTSANVSVTGPNGYNTSVTATTTLTQLPPGLYTIVGAATLSGNSNYFPSIQSQTSAVSSGATASVKVDFAIITPLTTKVLDAAGSQTLTVSPDGSTLTIPSSSKIASTLAPGDVLAVGVTNATPEGALRKVSSVSMNGSQVVVTTTQGTLADAFQQASLSFQGNLAATLSNVRVLRHGITVRKEQIPKLLSPNRARSNSLVDPCAGNPVTFIDMVDVPIVQDTSGDITISGQVEICPSFQFNWNIGGLPPQLSSLLATITFSSDTHVNLTGRYDNSFSQSVPLATLTGTPITLFIGPVPLVLFPQVSFFVGVSGDVTAGFSTGVAQTATVTGGISYNNGQLSPVFPAPIVNFAQDPLGIDAGFSAKGFAGATVAVLVEGVLSPQFSPDAYLQLDTNVTQNPWCTLTAGLEGPVSVDVNIFGFANLARLQLPSLFQYSSPIFQCSGGFSPSAAAPSLASIAPSMAIVGSQAQMVTINGSNFVPGSIVSFNGFSVPSAFVSPTTLSATIPQSDLFVPGSFPITVSNPDTVGADSSALNFVVSTSLTTPGVITTVAGSGASGYSGDGGAAVNANLSMPTAMAIDRSGNAFIVDSANAVIRRVDASTGIITTVAGNGIAGYSGDGGLALNAQLNRPSDILFDQLGNLCFTDSGNQRVRCIDQAGVITTLAGNGVPGFSGDNGPALNAEFQDPNGIGVDSSNNIYVADSQNNRIRRIAAATGLVTTVAGNGIAGYAGDGGPAISAELSFPARPVVDASGNIYISDLQNNRVREVNAADGIITTIAGTGQGAFSGDGGPAASATLNGPLSLALDSSGDLYISEVYNERIRVVNTTAKATTVLGVPVQPGDIETIAGIGVVGYSGDGGLAIAATLNSPTGLRDDIAGNLWFADSGNNVIRKILGP